MLVRHLSYFSVLAREQHFARAAEICNVAQPTLSAGIRTLEKSLGAQLVVRGRTFMGLTPEGKRVLEWARQILLNYDGLLQDLSGLGEGLTGTLRLGVLPPAMPCISMLTRRLLQFNPGLSVDVREMTSAAMQKDLDDFEIDAGFTYLDSEPMLRVRRLPFYVERFAFATRRTAKYGERGSVTWREAAEEPLCLLSEDMQNRRIINSVFHSLGLEPSPSITTNSFLAVQSHLRSGEWSSIIPHTFAYLFGDSDEIVIIPLVEPVRLESVGLVVPDRETESPITKALWAASDGGHTARAWTEQLFDSLPLSRGKKFQFDRERALARGSS
jgi:DNA-binding transcriptional LysR family regulator